MRRDPEHGDGHPHDLPDETSPVNLGNDPGKGHFFTRVALVNVHIGNPVRRHEHRPES